MESDAAKEEQNKRVLADRERNLYQSLETEGEGHLSYKLHDHASPEDYYAVRTVLLTSYRINLTTRGI